MKINVIHVTESEYLLLEFGNLHLNNYLISNRTHIVTNGKELQLEKVENTKFFKFSTHCLHKKINTLKNLHSSPDSVSFSTVFYLFHKRK